MVLFGAHFYFSWMTLSQLTCTGSEERLEWANGKFHTLIAASAIVRFRHLFTVWICLMEFPDRSLLPGFSSFPHFLAPRRPVAWESNFFFLLLCSIVSHLHLQPSVVLCLFVLFWGSRNGFSVLVCVIAKNRFDVCFSRHKCHRRNSGRQGICNHRNSVIYSIITTNISDHHTWWW